MAIPTKESLSGFIKSTPRLTYTQNGTARMFAWVGTPQSERDEQGAFHESEPVESPLIMFGASAERAARQFQKGDNFIAEGKTRPWTHEVNGQEVEEDQFVASRIGHDNNITDYTVERRAPERSQAIDPAMREAAQVDTPESQAVGGGAPTHAPTGQDGASTEAPGVQAAVAEVLAQREAQVVSAPAAAMPAPAARESVSR